LAGGHAAKIFTGFLTGNKNNKIETIRDCQRRPRRLIIEFKGKKPRVAPGAFIAPTAQLIGDVVVEEGASIWFGAVLRGDLSRIVIGKGSNVQDNVVIHTMSDNNTIIGQKVTIAHGAILHGCTVGDGAIVGMNAVLMDFCQIGEQAMVAAGSIVKERAVIPARHLVAGIPAEIKKPIEGNSLAWVERSAASYRQLTNYYLEQGLGGE